MREHTISRRVAAALTAGALVLGSLQTVALADEPPFTVDLEVLADRLLAAQVQIHHGGQPGIEGLLLSAEILEWRRQHPTASEPEITHQLEARHDALTDGITAADRMLSDAEFTMRATAVLVSDPERTAASAPHVRRLVEVALGKSIAVFDTREDLVNGSLRETAWLRARSEVESEVWSAVRRQALEDPAFASAWNGIVGFPTVDATASLDQLKTDPKLSALIDVDAILAQSGSRPAFLAEVQRQFGLVAAVLATESAEARARLVALSASCPVKTDVSCTPEQRAAAAATAASEQKQIDAAAAAAKALGAIARIGDRKTGEKIEKVAAAWFSIITAINKYGEAVAGRSAEDAILSGASLVLAGDVIGAVMTLVSLLGESTPSLDQQILDQIVKLRQEVRAMHEEMRASFERIETQLNTVFEVMLHEFDQLNATLAGNTAALTNIQNQLAEQDLRLETVAATILTAIGDVELHDARSDVNRYIGYRETFGQSIPTFGEYTEPENQFHFAATEIGTHSSFVVPPSLAVDPTVKPTAVLDSNGESAALSYLARLARFRDPRVPDPSEVFANPSVWNFGAQAYALLALQNPDYAAQVSEARSAQIGFEGQRILDVTSSFSRPAAPPAVDRTNPIFTTLTADYRSALGRLVARMVEIRNKQVLVRKERPYDPQNPSVPPQNPNVPFGTAYKSYSLFGSAGQVLPDATLPLEPASVKACGVPPIGALLSRPANLTFKALPPELRFANYAFAPVMEDTDRYPELGHCYDAQFTNLRETWGTSYHDTYARLRLTMRSRFRWSRTTSNPTQQDEVWRNARSASYTFPEVRIGHECISIHCSTSSSVTVQQELANRWPSGKALFEQSASIAVDGNTVTSVRTQMTAFLQGRQRVFYQKAGEEIHNANTELSRAGLDMGQAARQLQAYTRLGFPVALSNDDILSSTLFGRYPLLVNKAIDPQLETTINVAFNRYACVPSAPLGALCFNAFPGPFYPLRGQPHLETVTEGITVNDPVTCGVSTAGVAGLPGDPVGDCIVASSIQRLNRLEERYRHYSQMLANGTYAERLPWVASTLATLPLVDTIVRTEASN